MLASGWCLRRAAVKNTKRNERLQFDRLEPWAGSWIQATGEYTDSEGKVRDYFSQNLSAQGDQTESPSAWSPESLM